MKRIIASLLILAMLTSLAACAAPAAETKVSETPTQTEAATPSPTVDPTPTPEPTLSPEEVEQAEIMAEYEKYKDIYETSKDYIVLLFIKGMVEEGKITSNMLDDLKGPINTQTNAETEISFWPEYNDKVAILYGEHEEMQPEAISTVISQLLDDADQGILRLTYLKTDEERERLISAAKTVNEWYENPTDENKIKMEDSYFSDKLTLAEIIILAEYMNAKVIDKTGDSSDMWSTERDGTTIIERNFEAVDRLIEMNNTPYSEKGWFAYPNRPVVLSETELTDILALSDAELLKYCWENFGDEYAAVQLEHLHDQGKVTDSEFTQDVADEAARISESRQKKYQEAASVVNGQALDDMNAFICRNAYLRNGKITISLFDSREKQERVILGLNLIRAWLQNPTDENKQAFESLMLSDELTPGEFVFLFEYLKYYGDYLPMFIKVDEAKVERRESFVHEYLGGNVLDVTEDNYNLLAQTYRQYLGING